MVEKPENSKISPGNYIFQRPFFKGLIFGGAYVWRETLRFKIGYANLYIYIVGRNFMSAICRKVLLKLAFRMQTFVKCNHASTLSIWTKEILAKT